MTPTGLEPSYETPGKTAIGDFRGAELGAVVHDLDLAAVVRAWPTLTVKQRRAVLTAARLSPASTPQPVTADACDFRNSISGDGDETY